MFIIYIHTYLFNSISRNAFHKYFTITESFCLCVVRFSCAYFSQLYRARFFIKKKIIKTIKNILKKKNLFQKIKFHFTFSTKRIIRYHTHRWTAVVWFLIETFEELCRTFNMAIAMVRNFRLPFTMSELQPESFSKIVGKTLIAPD